MRNSFGILIVVLLVIAIPAAAQTPAYRAPRLNGHPDLNGIWQAVNTANWDLQDHPAQPGTLWQSGAIGAVPAGQSVVATQGSRAAVRSGSGFSSAVPIRTTPRAAARSESRITVRPTFGSGLDSACTVRLFAP